MTGVVILVLSIILTGVVVWAILSNKYQKEIITLQEENSNLKKQVGLNENIINEVKVAFSQIAQDSLKNQQETLLKEHATDLNTKIELFKSQEITPINKLLKEFKESIDNYQKSHQTDTQEIKNAISTAEKYAKALTTNQNSRGEFGEDWLEQILKFANLEENIHYSKQFISDGVKPDFVIKLPNDRHVVIDSKVILKNYLNYQQEENEIAKKAFITDLSNCIANLAKKNYEEIGGLSQAGFILMYIPIESCLNTIYTDYDFKKIIEQANSFNIIIIGTASLLVTLRLINQLWASQRQYDNVQNIITVAENLYNNIALHTQGLINIQQSVEKASKTIQTEINRFKANQNGSIIKEAEKLREYGINAKSSKTRKKSGENTIPEEFITENETN
jgi:DNA recombination protein RmuC